MPTNVKTGGTSKSTGKLGKTPPVTAAPPSPTAPPAPTEPTATPAPTAPAKKPAESRPAPSRGGAKSLAIPSPSPAAEVPPLAIVPPQGGRLIGSGQLGPAAHFQTFEVASAPLMQKVATCCANHGPARPQGVPISSIPHQGSSIALSDSGPSRNPPEVPPTVAPGTTPEQLQTRIRQVLGPNVKFTSTKAQAYDTYGNKRYDRYGKPLMADPSPPTWGTAELQSILTAVEKVPPADRAALANVTFDRKPNGPTEDVNGIQYWNRGDTVFNSNVKGGPVTVTLYDQALVNGNYRVGETIIHEVGHIVEGGGRLDPDAIREWAKLSHFERRIDNQHYLFSSYDREAKVINEDPYTSPLNKDNFVSEYARESAAEDFAESYRTYIANPNLLMQKAPEKFLFINATSKKYTNAELNDLATKNSADLPFAIAELKKSNFRPETLGKILQSNGFDPRTGDPGTGAGDAFAYIQRNANTYDFVSRFTANPQAALGSTTWSKLTPGEQALLKSPSYVTGLLDGARANAAQLADTVSDQDVKALQTFMSKLVNTVPSDAQKAAMSSQINPSTAASARINYYTDLVNASGFSPGMKQLFASTNAISTAAYDTKLSGQLEALWGGFTYRGRQYGPTTRDAAKLSAMNTGIGNIGLAEVQALGDALKSGYFKGGAFGNAFAAAAVTGGVNFPAA
jgi:hypothetical protein